MPFVFTNRNGGMRWGEQSIVFTNDNPPVYPTFATASISANSSSYSGSYSGYSVFTFLSSGTFTVTKGGFVSVLIVGGGGNGGNNVGGGGGGGQVVYFDTVSNPMTITSGSYNVVVGNGAPAYVSASSISGSSSFNSITANGGGNGVGATNSTPTSGGSGGGAGYYIANGAGATNKTTVSNAFFNGGNNSRNLVEV